MADLSPDEWVINAEDPLANCLEYIREPLRKLEQGYKPSSLSCDGAADSPDSGPQKAISRLFYTLQGHEITLNLRFEIGDSDLAM